MPFLELFDETLDINSTENYELSVEISVRAVSFSVFDSIRHKFIMLRSYQPENDRKYSFEELEGLVHKDDFLKKNYKKTNIITPSAKFTLIPEQLYDPGKKDEYFRFNHLPEEDYIVLNNKMKDPDSYLVYGLPRELFNILGNEWPEAYPIHHIKPLFEHIRLNRKGYEVNYIHAHFEYDFFTLIYYNNNILKFCNSFNYRSDSDILYYILNMFRSMEIRQEETIFISGHTDRCGDLFSTLQSYVRTVKVDLPSGDFTFSYVLNEAGLQKYINLFNVIRCE